MQARRALEVPPLQLWLPVGAHTYSQRLPPAQSFVPRFRYLSAILTARRPNVDLHGPVPPRCTEPVTLFAGD